MGRGWLRWLIMGIACVQSGAQAQDRPVVRAVRADVPVSVDGVLQEDVWRREGFSAFRQREPDQGAAPTERTEVWVAFDDAALYVAARMYDSTPDSINRRLGRRDEYIDTDYFSVFVDGYHDRQSGNYFSVSAAGVQYDGVLYNDDWDDTSWDGVWESKTSFDGEGWTAEIRIPYSQLRFHDGSDHVWGINFRRDIARRNEQDYLSYTPRNESGFVSRFGDLTGLTGITPPARLSFLPYMTTKAELTPAVNGNPFNDGSRVLPGMGLDLQTGFGSNLTLNATINPDFGQVEVDPAVINLSDVETYFQEKRPFFVEGANTFDFGYGGSNNYWGFNWGNPTIFYSRRIGRAPQGSLPSHDFADAPQGTHILGAAKLTGRLDDRTTFGLIQAVTNREFTRIQSTGVRSRVEVEPLTYYGILRAQRTFDDRRYGVGVIGTGTRRFFDDPSLIDQINREAFVGGADGWAFLDDDRTYVVTGMVTGSLVRGSSNRLLALQQSSSHYFQRPDVAHIRLDSSAKAMSGSAGRFTLNKQKGAVELNAAFGFISPGYEINDMGFQSRTDYMNAHVVTGYRWMEPTSWYRSLFVRVSHFRSWDFGGNLTWSGYWSNIRTIYPNYWGSYFGVTYNPSTFNQRRTRGGPLTVNPPGVEMFGGVWTDSRQDVVAELNAFRYFGGGQDNWSIDPFLEFKPTSGLSMRLGPSYGEYRSQAQWVGSYDDPTAVLTYGRQYAMADFHQRTLSANLRINWIASPVLSLQVFVQPLISSGAYTNFKRLARARSFEFETYGSGASSIARHVAGDGSVAYDVDADGAGPAPAYGFSNPDFNFRSVRGNAVLRWEFRPGSTVYLVWTQSRSDVESIGEFQFSRSLDRLITAKPDNIFLLKFTYWWSV